MALLYTTVSSTILVNHLRDGGNESAWRQFSARYEPMLLAVVRRADLQEPDAADVVQETLVDFLRDFQSGKYDPQKGRIRAWLRGIAVNRVKRVWGRAAKREVQVVDPTGATGYLNRIPDDKTLTDIFDEEWHRAVMATCMDEVRRQVDDQTFQAFELFAMKDWPAEKVAEHLGVTRNVVYISKNRVLTRMRQAFQDISEDW